MQKHQECGKGIKRKNNWKRPLTPDAKSARYTESGEIPLGTEDFQRTSETLIQHYERALENARQRGYKQEETLAYLALGHTYRLNDQVQPAMQHYEKALEIARERGYKLEETKAYLGLGGAYRLNKQIQPAIDHYEKGLEIARERGYKLKETQAKLMLAEAHRWDNQIGPAMQHFGKVFEIPRERGYKLEETKAYLEIGHVFKLNNQFQPAMQHYEKAFEIARERGYKQEEMKAYFALGETCKVNNQIQQAMQYYAKALEVAREQGYKLQETQGYVGLGGAYGLNNQVQLAIENYEKALEIARERGYKLQATQAYSGLGEAYRLNNQIQLAMRYYEKALVIAGERGYKLEEIRAYIGLGESYGLNNQFQPAMQHCEKAWEIAREQGYKLQETEAYVGLGETYRLNNLIQLTIEYYEKALEIARERGCKLHETTACVGLGLAYRFNNQIQPAIEHYEKALEIARERGYETIARSAIAELSRITGEPIYAKAVQIDANIEEKSLSKNVVLIQEQEPTAESQEPWKWEKKSIFHREKFIKLSEHGKNHPEKIKEVNGVRVCCSKEFLIGKGSDGTRVYIGLGKDGVERAVKRLHKDSCSGLAEQEKKVLTKLNTTKSIYVANYWFLEEQSDQEYLFLFLDLCEETLSDFIGRSSLNDLIKITADIIRQILKGLTDLHRDPNPILHRDLKPSNIMRNVQGNWLLADFGISRILTEDDSTYTSTQRGTENWTAVECYPLNGITDAGKVRYKKESDIQVAGMVAFFIATKGEHPFGERADRLRNLLDGNPVGLVGLKDCVLKDLLS